MLNLFGFFEQAKHFTCTAEIGTADTLEKEIFEVTLLTLELVTSMTNPGDYSLRTLLFRLEWEQ